MREEYASSNAAREERPADAREFAVFARRLLLLLLLLAASWLALYFAWRAVPHVRAGHQQIYDYKLSEIAGGEIFPQGAPEIRLVIFGNSRVQAGFRPDLFDELSGGAIHSYNLGLPATSSFLDELETLVARGQVPTHVLLTLPWSEKEKTAYAKLLGDDHRLISTLFPFRHFFRDLGQFFVRAGRNGGIRAYYRHMAGLVAQARRDRGYFFIENQSHFPGHRLPADFHVASESPDEEWARPASASSPHLERLLSLSRRAGFKVLLVPEYYREAQYAPASEYPKGRSALAQYGVLLLGPNYWRYPNRFFSDPTHLNREGADLHTRNLWQLVEPHILGEAPIEGHQEPTHGQPAEEKP